MKKILLTIAAIALFAVPASAQVYSLWSDETMSECDFFGDAYAAFNVYLMLEPGPTGVFAAEYMLVMPATPANVIVQLATPSPDISVAMGSATGEPGISLGFDTCHNETFMVYSFLMLPLGADPGYFMIEPHAETGKLIIAECPGIREELPATAYNHFGYNDACVVGTEESSWGAIKSMMD